MRIRPTNFLLSLARWCAALCVVAGAVGLAACGSGSAATAPANPTTVVLVHGAWADGSSWNKVIPILKQRGLKVVAVQLARASLADDAATVSRTIAAQSGQVVLVAHSYGGAVITEAGGGATVAALVYVSAFAPGDGQSANDLVAGAPAAPWQADLKPDAGGYLRLSDATITGSFAPDLSAAEQSLLMATQGPIYYHVLADPVTVAAWKSKPSWWVYGTADMIIPAALQQAESTRLGAKTTAIAGASHVALLSHPAEVAAVILDAVGGVGGL